MRYLMSLALAAGLMAPASFAAAADDQPTPVTFAIRVADLDLSKRQDVHSLMHRIGVAAAGACGAPLGANPIDAQMVRDSDCYKEATRDAVARVNSPALNEAYGRSTLTASNGD